MRSDGGMSLRERIELIVRKWDREGECSEEVLDAILQAFEDWLPGYSEEKTLGYFISPVVSQIEQIIGRNKLLTEIKTNLKEKS